MNWLLIKGWRLCVMVRDTEDADGRREGEESVNSSFLRQISEYFTYPIFQLW